MHTAIIKGIAVDAANRYFVTGSLDKTIRVWELSTGRLLQTLRPPIGDGDEGKIYAIALSPDGKTIACGGLTGGALAGSDSIFFFDRESGRLTHHIAGLSNVITCLAYSKDGRSLAAVLGDGGLRVFRTADLMLIGKDLDYATDSYGVDFDSAGRLVTACLDGYVRLYDPSFHRIAKVKPLKGVQPYSVRFSPDGTRIAVGYYNLVRVDVLSGLDLTVGYSPKTDGANDDLFSVAWSSDGEILYAGGEADKGEGVFIRSWSNGGRGDYQDYPVCTSTIMELRSLRDGGVAFAGSDPAFGILSRDGKTTLLSHDTIADYRDVGNQFLVSMDGDAVQFGFKPFAKSPARFLVSRRLLEQPPYAKPEMALTAPNKEGMNVTDWENNQNPKFNGKELGLYKNEWSLSLSIAPDKQSFLLGTEWYLRLYDKDGKQIWPEPVSIPSPAWGVNISGDEKVAVAAFGDGTIRWYRMTDGKELLAFFPHADKQRWVAWTPSGYYDCSPGGEDLIGWHVNRFTGSGKDRVDEASDFFPASRFRSAYYRPDVIARALTALDENEALKQADAALEVKKPEVAVKDILPPVVRIVSPSDSALMTGEKVTVKYTLRTPSGDAVKGVKVLIDGRPVGKTEEIDVNAPEEVQRMREVQIPARDCVLTVVALGSDGRASVPASVRLAWRGPSPVVEPTLFKPTLYVLAVGVGEYDNSQLKLTFPAKDASDFAAMMLGQKGQLYEDVIVRLLQDKRATKDAVLDGLDWIQRETTSKDVAMVFLSGHGVRDPNRYYYYAPVGIDLNRLKTTGVAYSEITNTMGAIAGKAVFFVDTCHAGFAAGHTLKGVDITEIVSELVSAENGAIVFAASTGNEDSEEDPTWRNGAFTKALIEGLTGQADKDKTGRITVTMLNYYIAERVKHLTNGVQHPTTTIPPSVPDFPIAVVKP